MSSDRFVSACPYCGGTEMIEVYQCGHAAVMEVNSMWHVADLYHAVCRRCGSVVRSYVKEPEKLLSCKDRSNPDED